MEKTSTPGCKPAFGRVRMLDDASGGFANNLFNSPFTFPRITLRPYPVLLDYLQIHAVALGIRFVRGIIHFNRSAMINKNVLCRRDLRGIAVSIASVHNAQVPVVSYLTEKA
jgi:hypothetical protein